MFNVPCLTLLACSPFDVSRSSPLLPFAHISLPRISSLFASRRPRFPASSHPNQASIPHAIRPGPCLPKLCQTQGAQRATLSLHTNWNGTLKTIPLSRNHTSQPTARHTIYDLVVVTVPSPPGPPAAASRSPSQASHPPFRCLGLVAVAFHWYFAPSSISPPLKHNKRDFTGR